MNRHSAIYRVLILGSLAVMGYSANLNADTGQVLLHGSSPTSVGDNFNFFRNPVIFTFKLPRNTLVSGASSARAVLKLETNNVNMPYDEVYVNPPTSTCFAENSGIDENDPASIGYLETRTANPETGAWYTLELTFPGSMLRPGTNAIMVCGRARDGALTGPHDQQGSGGIDDFFMRNVVLQYRR